jgi:hypothetical protein
VQSSPKNISSEGSLLTILDTPETTGTLGLESSLAKNDSQQLARRLYSRISDVSPAQILPAKPLVQSPELLVVGYVHSQAKVPRDDPGEEIKTEIEAKEQQQQPIGLTQLENTIAPSMETLSTQVPSQSVVQSSPKNTSKEGSLLAIQTAQGNSGKDGRVFNSGRKVIDKIDDISDQTYDDHLVGKKFRCNFEKGWPIGKIEYFNIQLKEYFVLFEDGNSDYIKEDDIDVSNISQTSATYDFVPQQTEKLQRVQISYSNDGKDQIHDLLLPSQNEVQTPDDQLQILPQSLKESSKENIEISIDFLEIETEKNNDASIEKSEQIHQNTEEGSNSEDSKMERPEEFSQENIERLVRYQVSVSENVKKHGRKRPSFKGQVSNQKGMRDHAHQGLAKAAMAKG